MENYFQYDGQDQHHHPPPPLEEAYQRFKTAMRDEIRRDHTRGLRRTYDLVAIRLHGEGVPIPEYDSVRKAL